VDNCDVSEDLHDYFHTFEMTKFQQMDETAPE
jgi:hypothetical protein